MGCVGRAGRRIRPAKTVIETQFNEAQGQLSPDGRWIAYAADESSSFDVYVQRLEPGGRRWRISLAGGSDPRWNPNGSELFYVSADGWLMVCCHTADRRPAAGGAAAAIQDAGSGIAAAVHVLVRRGRGREEISGQGPA